MRRVFKKALDTIDMLDTLGEEALKDASFSLNLSIIGLQWSDLGGRLGSVRSSIVQFIEVPQELNSKYLENCLKAVSPDQVGLSVDFQLAALVVTSEAAGGGFGLTLNRDSFLKAAGRLFSVIGL